MTCSRCGICCRKGGPALHEPDLELLEKKILGRGDLVTLRRGELALDPFKGDLVVLEQELIKIKGAGYETEHSWMCRLFDEDDNACRIYDARPIECQALECTAPDPLKDINKSPHLLREHLVQHGSGMWDIIQEHEVKCDFKTLGPVCEKIAKGNKALASELVAAVEYDRNLRAALVQKTGAKIEELDVLLGRALIVAVEAYGIQLERKGKGSYALKRIRPRSRPF